MNWDQIEGKWKQSMGKVKEKWGKLTDDDMTAINGKKEQLVGKIQERYGIAKDAAEKQVDEFTRSYSSDDSAKELSRPEWGREVTSRKQAIANRPVRVTRKRCQGPAEDLAHSN